ncbi:MAG: hypothetical protein ACK5HT_22540 [Draconibacterium sp.]
MIEKEIEIDSALVNEAFTTLQGIFITHHQNALLEAANYLAKTFFNNDVELIRKKKPAPDKEGSFLQLITQLAQSDTSVPSKSWMYNAIGIFVDSKDLEKNYKKIFHTYGKLPISHKVKLLTVRDLGQKVELIESIEKDKLTVRDLQEKIKETRKSRRGSGKKRIKPIKVKLAPKNEISEIEKSINPHIKRLEKVINEAKEDKMSEERILQYEALHNALLKFTQELPEIIEISKTKG